MSATVIQTLQKTIEKETKKLQEKANKKFTENFTCDTERKLKELFRSEESKGNISYSENQALLDTMRSNFRNIKPQKRS